MMKCPNCSQELKEKFARCPFCECSLEDNPSQMASAASDATAQKPDAKNIENDVVLTPQPVAPPPQADHNNSASANPASCKVKANEGLIPAVICCLCCQAFGICALILSVQTGSLIKQGQYEKAEKYARYSKLISGIGIAIGVIWALTWGILNFCISIPNSAL